MKQIPRVVSAIIIKLLAKTAEDRYQTAAGLERDLRRCQLGGESDKCPPIGSFRSSTGPSWLALGEIRVSKPESRFAAYLN